jgi:hypothetical protein
LLLSDRSVTRFRSSAHANNQYVASGADFGTVTVTEPVDEVTPLSGGMLRAPLSRMSLLPLTMSRDR